MLISDYIKSKITKFGAIIDNNELEGLLLKNSIVDEIFTADNAVKAEKALCSYIPELLGINTIAEGGYRIQLDKDGLMAYYSSLCEDLQIPNRFSVKQPKIKNKSYLW